MENFFIKLIEKMIKINCKIVFQLFQNVGLLLLLASGHSVQHSYSSSCLHFNSCSCTCLPSYSLSTSDSSCPPFLSPPFPLATALPCCHSPNQCHNPTSSCSCSLPSTQLQASCTSSSLPFPTSSSSSSSLPSPLVREGEQERELGLVSLQNCIQSLGCTQPQETKETKQIARLCWCGEAKSTTTGKKSTTTQLSYVLLQLSTTTTSTMVILLLLLLLLLLLHLQLLLLLLL